MGGGSVRRGSGVAAGGAGLARGGSGLTGAAGAAWEPLVLSAGSGGVSIVSRGGTPRW
jgi:hypothetical protein